MAIRSVNPLIKVIAIPLVIIILGFLVIHIFSSNSQKSQMHNVSNVVNNNATADSNVETLKTLTAEMSAVEQQNEVLQKENKNLQDKDRGNLDQYKASLLQDVQKQVTSSLQAANQTSQSNINQAIADIKNGTTNSSDQNNNPSYSIKGNNDDNPNFVWISDESQSASVGNATDFSDLSLKHTLLNQTRTEASIVNTTNDSNSTTKTKPLPIPYYTLPVNATLTGAIAMQPLIGRIPIDGKIPDPYTFKAIIGPKNLAANGVDIPSAIQGIVVSGVLKGDMLGGCVRSDDITALTFVFQDGTISTTEAQSGGSLGTIAAADGNPCILGTFHTNAPLFLSAQAALAGLQGYGNALSQAQVSNVVSPTGGSISTIVGNANTYAFGQGASSSAQAMQHWWDQRVQNSFDYVFVPNVDPKTKQLLTLNINITQEIPINYDPNGRKVFYDHEKNPFVTANFD